MVTLFRWKIQFCATLNFWTLIFQRINLFNQLPTLLKTFYTNLITLPVTLIKSLFYRPSTKSRFSWIIVHIVFEIHLTSLSIVFDQEKFYSSFWHGLYWQEFWLFFILICFGLCSFLKHISHSLSISFRTSDTVSMLGQF